MLHITNEQVQSVTNFQLFYTVA